jgi:hypothetical protein
MGKGSLTCFLVIWQKNLKFRPKIDMESLLHSTHGKSLDILLFTIFQVVDGCL